MPCGANSDYSQRRKGIKSRCARARDRARLLLALDREELLPEGVTVDPVSLPEMTPALLRQLQTFLARSPARLLVVQLEDVLGVREQVNLPGTTSEHPNWRRKLPLALERWPDDARYTELTRALAAVRPLVLLCHKFPKELLPP